MCFRHLERSQWRTVFLNLIDAVFFKILLLPKKDIRLEDKKHQLLQEESAVEEGTYVPIDQEGLNK